MSRGFDFYGGNADAFNSTEPEVLLAGAAGSGKTLAWLSKLLTVANNHPGCRQLIVRKTRESLTESVLVTWENAVLGPRHPVLLKNPTLRRVRQSYRFANGSEIVVGGMDKPDKVLSSEWDLIYCPEATDLTLIDWETLGGRLRNGRVPWQQLAGDCNPTTPTHWLYKRTHANGLRMYSSTHKDNPQYWDRAAQRWTQAGERYVRQRLERMTGARRKRFLEGEWAAAEGLVYDGYSPTLHLLAESFEAPASWPRLWSIDWGFVNPSVLQVWAIDGDGRLYLVREFYATRTRAEMLAKLAREWNDAGLEPEPTYIICDHDPDCADTWRAHFGQTAELADKTDKCWGIEQAQARLDVQADERPRIFFHPRARRHEPDPHLSADGRPTSTLEELAGYVWDTANPDRVKDEPVKKNDHGCDAMRYACRKAESFSPDGDREMEAANAEAAAEAPYGHLFGR